MQNQQPAETDLAIDARIEQAIQRLGCSSRDEFIKTRVPSTGEYKRIRVHLNDRMWGSTHLKTRERLAKLLEVRKPSDLFDPRPNSDATKGVSEHLHLETAFFAHVEENLGPGDEIFFAGSPNFFIEQYLGSRVDARAFRSFIERCVIQEVGCTWIFPNPLQRGKKYLASYNEAVKFFDQLVVRLSTPSNAKPVLARYFIHESGSLAEVGGAIVILRRRGRAEAFRIFLLDSQEHGDFQRPRYLRMHDSETVWSRLLDLTLPEECPKLSSNRLDSKIQEAYRGCKADDNFDDLYMGITTSVRFTPQSRESIGTEIISVFSNRKDTDQGSLSILEIGAGNMNTSRRLFYNPAHSFHTLHVTALDSASHSGKREIMPGKESSIRYLSNTVFELWRTEERFDIILAFHSLYVMDPFNIWKMCALLKKGGVLAILHSPYVGNGFSSIASSVGQLLGPKKPFEGKSITEDPHRIYAEDIRKHLEERLFVDYQVIPLEGKFFPDKVFAETEAECKLTDAGAKVFRFHGMGAMELLESNLGNATWIKEVWNKVRKNAGPMGTTKDGQRALSQKEELILITSGRVRLREILRGEDGEMLSPFPKEPLDETSKAEMKSNQI